MRKRILVVAAENVILQTVPITLNLAGHKVVTADCGLEAIKQSRSLLPDLVLIDAQLPDMDGATIVDILRRLPSTATLPTILLKARGNRHDGASEAQEPLSSSELLLQVAQALAACQNPADAPELDGEWIASPAT